MKLWSGPGRALQEHLARWECVYNGTKEVARHRTVTPDGKDAIEIRGDTVPGALVGWATFARSYGSLDDGSTQAARELTESWFSQRNLAIGMVMMTSEALMLNEAVTHYVSLHIAELVTELANLAEPEPLFPTDLPTPHGLIVLEHPIIMQDIDPDDGHQRDDLPLPIRAIGWRTDEVGDRDEPGKTKPGIDLVIYTEADSYNEVYVPAVELLGVRVEHEMDWRLCPVDYNPWGFGTIWNTSALPYDEIDHSKHLLIGSVSYIRRWFLSLMRLMWQEILQPDIFPPSRPVRKRMERMSWKGGGDVKVLRLRRIYRSESDREESDGWVLNHRYIRRGHWRNQFYPSLGTVDDPNSHRLIWIMPTVCGPEDRPLIVKHNVTAIVR